MSSDTCPSFSRSSFDALELPPPSTYSPDNLMLKPHRSSESSWQDIRSAAFKRTNDGGGGLSFRDFSLVRQIGSGDIGKVFLCRLRGGDDSESERRFYAMKVVDREVLAMKKKIQRAEPSRSDEGLDPDQQFQITNQVRAQFDSMVPKRPSKPNRSEPDFTPSDPLFP